MNDTPIKVAGELLNIYGSSLLEDPERLGQLLEDRCGEYRHEIFVLSFALREISKKEVFPVASDLRKDREMVEKRFAEQLGFSKQDAHWALDAILSLLDGSEKAESLQQGEQFEARRGFLQNVGAGIAKRPRTAPVRKKALHNGLLLLGIAMLFLVLFVRITPTRYTMAGEHRVLFLAHLSGTEAPSGHVRLKAAQLAADQINAQGGVKGRLIRVLAQDAPAFSDGLRASVLALAREKNVTAIISACDGEMNSVLASAADELEMPLLITESGRLAATLSQRERPWLYSFRANYDNAYRGKALAYFASQGLKRTKVALLSLGYDEDSQEIREAFLSVCGDYMLELVCEGVYTRRGAVDQATAAEIVASGAEVLVVANPTSDIPAVMRMLRRSGYGNTVLGLSYDDTLLHIAGSAMENSWWIVPASPEDPQLLSFQTSYRDKYNEPISPQDFSGTILAYDSVRWMADALYRAPGFQGEALRHAFLSTRNLALAHATLSIDPRNHSPWNKALALVYCSGGKGRFQKRFRVQ